MSNQSAPAISPPQLLPLVVPLLRRDEPVVCPDPDVAGHLQALGFTVAAGTLVDQPPGMAGAVVLVSGEVADAGRRGPVLVSAAVDAVRPGGMVAVAARSTHHAALVAGDGDAGGTVTATELDHMLAERGLDVRLLAGPGAAATIGGRGWAGPEDLELDRSPGLRDAGPHVLAVARTPKDGRERSERFFASVAYKIVGAAVLCRDADERILLVFDLFKQAWTLPGGLVDAEEDPAVAAGREALEEGGVEVEVGAFLGLFAHAHPDRLQVVYAARPRVPTPAPVPIHTHEVSESRWVTRAEAESMLDPFTRRRLTACLDDPGRTWRW